LLQKGLISLDQFEGGVREGQRPTQILGIQDSSMPAAEAAALMAFLRGA
jgi:hypothetical protein